MPLVHLDQLRIVGYYAMSLAAIVGTIGNIAAVTVLGFYHRMRNNHNLFILSLAISDLIVSAIVVPFAIFVAVDGQWNLGWNLCSFFMSLDVSSATASINNLGLICFDRFLKISKPLKYSRIMTRCTVRCLIAGTWAISFALSIVPIFTGIYIQEGLEHQVGNDSVTTCIFLPNKIFSIAASMISFFIPGSVMVILYGRLYFIARQKANVVIGAHLLKSKDDDCSLDSETTEVKNKALYTIGTMLGFFIFCWLPFFVYMLVTTFYPSTFSGLLFDHFTWLGYINSTANPFIYALFSHDFRVGLKRLLFLNFKNFFIARDSQVTSYVNTRGFCSLTSVNNEQSVSQFNYSESSDEPSSSEDEYHGARKENSKLKSSRNKKVNKITGMFVRHPVASLNRHKVKKGTMTIDSVPLSSPEAALSSLPALQEATPSSSPALQDATPSSSSALQETTPLSSPALQEMTPLSSPALQEMTPLSSPALQEVTLSSSQENENAIVSNLCEDEIQHRLQLGTSVDPVIDNNLDS